MLDSKNLKLGSKQARLEEYYKAEIAILSGQEYQIGTMRLKRADLQKVQNAISELEKETIDLSSNTGGKRKVIRAIPIDL